MTTTTRTLLVSTHQPDIQVEELHLNCWFLGPDKLDVEIGMEIRVPAQADQKLSKIELTCFLPLPIAGEVQDVTNALANEGTAKLLFNEIPSIQKSQGRRANSWISVIGRSSGAPLVLVDAELKAESEHAVKLTLRADDIPLNGVAINPDSSLHFYTRFRYRVDSGATANSGIEPGLFRDRMFIDLRVNEMRLAGATVAKHEVVTINTLRVFLIHPLHCHLAADPAAHRRYSRLLECGSGGWSSYFPKVATMHRGLLIHQWKMEPIKDKNFAIVFLLLWIEKTPAQKAITSFAILLLAAVVYAISGRVFGNAASEFRAGAVGAAITVFLALVADALYDAHAKQKSPIRSH